MEEGTKKEKREYSIVREWVEKRCHTKWMNNYKKFNSAVTCKLDLQAFGPTPKDAESSLINKVFANKLCRKYILKPKK